MRILLDTNVVLDVLLNRQPFVNEAQQVWLAHDEGRFTGYITATTLTNIFYLARRSLGSAPALQAIKICLDTFQVCDVNRQALVAAVALSGSDFEDDLQIACALMSGLDAIVTRNKKDFDARSLDVLDPGEFLSLLPPHPSTTSS